MTKNHPDLYSPIYYAKGKTRYGQEVLGFLEKGRLRRSGPRGGLRVYASRYQQRGRVGRLVDHSSVCGWRMCSSSGRPVYVKSQEETIVDNLARVKLLDLKRGFGESRTYVIGRIVFTE